MKKKDYLNTYKSFDTTLHMIFLLLYDHTIIDNRKFEVDR